MKSASAGAAAVMRISLLVEFLPGEKCLHKKNYSLAYEFTPKSGKEGSCKKIMDFMAVGAAAISGILKEAGDI